MKYDCKELRYLTIIDMFVSTGMRVRGIGLLNREDINFTECECVVFRKRKEERNVYFNARTKMQLQNYLESWSDYNPALFVSLNVYHERLQISPYLSPTFDSFVKYSMFKRCIL